MILNALRRASAAALLTLFAAPICTAAKSEVAPLPVEVVADLHTHNGRSPLSLSPDGMWVAHTYSGVETVSRDTGMYSATGIPFAEGNALMQAMLTHTRSGETIPLGERGGASWAAVWSPDGRHVAFYSDAGGEAGLWIWNVETRTARRIPNVVVRPFFGFENVRWAADGRRLLVKLLPADMTLAEANGVSTGAGPETDPRFPPVADGEPSVFVLSSEPKTMRVPPKGTPPPGSPAGGPVPRRAHPSSAELAIVDIGDDSVLRIGEYAQIRDYAFSPDQTHVAYVVMRGFEPNTQQALYDIVLHALATGERRTLAAGARMAYGVEWKWSPDSTHIAYIDSGLGGDGSIVVLPLAGGEPVRLDGRAAKGFDTGYGILAPWWDRDSTRLYAVGVDGGLWRAVPATGEVSRVAAIEGQRITEIVASPVDVAVWSRVDDDRIWVMSRERTGASSGIYSIDPATGDVHAGLVEPERQYSTYFNLDASARSGEIAYVASDQRHHYDVWMFDTATGKTRQATRLNPDLHPDRLGRAKLVDWIGRDGKPARGTLLLPPDHVPGTALPMVVWVYAGDRGAEKFDAFGLLGKASAFNMHILATRGYAVFFPDVPAVGEGTQAQDVLDAVVPAVEAMVAQGYADPDRIAVMGQSYGAYNVLSLLTQTSMFKAAVLSGAVVHPDLVAGYLEMRKDGLPANIGYFEQGQGGMGGSPWEYPERYRDNSPIYSFDRIDTPVLIGQGEKDGTLAASDAIFVALQRLGKPVEYRIYQDESHVMQHRANVVDFWNRRLEFLDRYLGSGAQH